MAEFFAVEYFGRNFLGNFFWRIFMGVPNFGRCSFDEIFLVKFFGEIFWEDFWEDIFGRNFLGGLLGGFFGRNSTKNYLNIEVIDLFVKIPVFVKILG